MKPYDIYLKFVKYYRLGDNDQQKLWSIIAPICEHKEFIKRCNAPFFHHDQVTLGEHLICDTIKTYQLAKKKKNVDTRIACLIAIFHDFYEIPWQNVHDHKKLFNKHGFVHPIEASINVITWYPIFFKNNKESEIVIDGIIHHMFPLPVRAINGSELDLNNQSKFDSLPNKYKEMIINSSIRKHIGKISVCRSKYKEGIIMSKADKKVALGLEIKRPSSLLRLIHGNNKKIAKK